MLLDGVRRVTQVDNWTRTPASKCECMAVWERSTSAYKGLLKCRVHRLTSSRQVPGIFSTNMIVKYNLASLLFYMSHIYYLTPCRVISLCYESVCYFASNLSENFVEWQLWTTYKKLCWFLNLYFWVLTWKKHILLKSDTTTDIFEILDLLDHTHYMYIYTHPCILYISSVGSN